MDTMKAIAKRKSTRGYKPDQPPADVLDSILAAGCAAPVGRAKFEDMHLTVVQDKALLGRITAAAQRVMGMDADPLYAAPTLVVICSKEPMGPGMDYVNGACITENMLLAATDKGVDSVLLWSPGAAIESDAALKKDLGIPDGCKALFGVALGYAAKPDDSEKELKISLSVNRV